VDKEQEYNRLLEALLVGVDMEDDVSRKMGYNACLAHAQQELAKSAEAFPLYGGDG